MKGIGVTFCIVMLLIVPLHAAPEADGEDAEDPLCPDEVLARIVYLYLDPAKQEAVLRQWDRTASLPALAPAAGRAAALSAGRAGGLQNSSWPMVCHDVRHTGLSPHSTLDTPHIVKWRLQVGGWIQGGISIDEDGTLYFGDNVGLNAAYPNGTRKWNYPVENWAIATPAIGSDGTVYYGGRNCYLYAMWPNGTLRWMTHCGVVDYGSPAIADDGTIYVGASNDLVAVAADGTVKWRYPTRNYMFSAPAIGSDGTVYFGGDNHVYAVHPDGTLRWQYLTGHKVMGSASIAADGTVYIASWDGYLYAFHPGNGTLRWRCRIGDGAKNNPSIGPDGTIYVGCDALYAVNPDGTVHWAFDLGPLRHTGWPSPAICADGIIYVGAEIGNMGGGEIIAINPNGTERWRHQVCRFWVDSSPTIGPDGTVYIGTTSGGPDGGSDGGSLYAFGLGPVKAHANGPYTGYYQQPVRFRSEAYGGIPPYTYHWDFGDGNTSGEPHPAHAYDAVGNYNATLTVHDSEGGVGVDIAAVTIVYAPPSVDIVTPRPKNMYLFGLRIPRLFARFYTPLVIGPITVEAAAHQNPFGIERVEFIINGKWVATVTEPPYQWRWSWPSFFRTHTLRVDAYDTRGEVGSTSHRVNKIL